MVKRKKKSEISIFQRFSYFSIGLFIAMGIMIYSFKWEMLPFEFTFGGVNITPYALSGIIVIFGIFASSLIKSGLKGKKELDV